MKKGKTERKVRKASWLWWVVFPPYAMYRFLKTSQWKWYAKVPLCLFVSLMLVIAIDLSLSPHRVEEAEAKEVVADFLTSERSPEAVRKVERMGKGVSVKGTERQPVVFYRAVTETGLYHMGLTGTENGKGLQVHHAEQLFPIRRDVKDMAERTKVEVALWLSDNEEVVGKAMKLAESDEEGQVITTEEGSYEIKYGNQSVYEVNDITGEETLLKRENAPVMPDELMTNIQKKEAQYGAFKRALAYEMDNEKEIYYFRTETNDFIAEIYDDGTIQTKKRRK